MRASAHPSSRTEVGDRLLRSVAPSARCREKTPKDPAIRERFDTYRFADHKEKVVDLLARVTRVSVETMRIVGEMEAASR